MSVPRPVTSVRAIKVRPHNRTELPEQVVTEEPLQIQVAGPGQEPTPLAVTMRTPGHDFDLAVGFVVTEGVAGPPDIKSVAYCDEPAGAEGWGGPGAEGWGGPGAEGRGGPGAEGWGGPGAEGWGGPGAEGWGGPGGNGAARYNVVTVRLGRRWHQSGPPRSFRASASCGLCGKTTIDEIEAACPPVGPAAPLPASVVRRLPDRLRSNQKVFDRTGGLHAAGLFDRGGDLWCVREDVGRHNAVDKVVGHTILGPPRPEAAGDGQPALAGWVLVVSGRVSFEIVQKAALAGIGTIAAVSAPSSLAVDAARRIGVAVLGFVRDESFNVYSHPERVAFDR
jgi:FdhD protein